MTAVRSPKDFFTDWSADGSGVNREIGVVLVHGYTGTPSSMRPWAEYLNQQGYTVRVPLLPGHGTKPEDLSEIKWQQWPEKVDRTTYILNKPLFLSLFFRNGLDLTVNYSTLTIDPYLKHNNFPG